MPRRPLPAMTALACACCLFSGCGEIAKSGFKGALQKMGATVVKDSSDANLRKMFEKANANCPTRMDQFTTLEEVEMIDDTRVEFRYLVNDAGRKLVSRVDKRVMKKNAVNHMKGNPMAVAIAERDLSIEHIYKDSAGNHLLAYTINRDVLNGDLDPVGSAQTNPFDLEITTVKTEGAPNVAEEVEEMMQPPLPNKPELPQRYKPTKASKDNPAGIQVNPYFSEIDQQSAS